MLGAAMENIGVGIAIGIAIGAGIGAAMQRRESDSGPDGDSGQS